MRIRFHAVALFALALGACSSGRSPAAASPAAPVPAEASGTIFWYGGPTAIIERAGIRVLTDPMLGPRSDSAFISTVTKKPVPRLEEPAAQALGQLDVVLVSHAHADHFMDARARELLARSTLVIGPPTTAAQLREWGFDNVRILDWGESMTVSASLMAPITALTITAVPAEHAHPVDLVERLGKGNGYVLEWHGNDPREKPYRVYWTGDAVLNDNMRLVAEKVGSIDVLMPDMGGVDFGTGILTHNAASAVELFRIVKPRFLIPIHHSTFGHYREPIEALQTKMTEAGFASRLKLVSVGQALPLP